MPPSPFTKDLPASTAEVFRANLLEGRLLRPDGQACAVVGLDFLSGLVAALADRSGEFARDVLYRSGYEWGLQEMLRLNEASREELRGRDTDLWRMDPSLVFSSWWKPMQLSGWGTSILDFSRLHRGIVVAELRQSAFADAAQAAAQPVCHHHAGLLAGGLSFFERAERHSTEIRCRALGHEFCQFVVGPGSDVDAAESARQKGADATEIISRLG